MDKDETGRLRALLEQLRDELDARGKTNAQAQDPLVLDQQSVGRVSRIDAMQHQAMARAHERKRKSDLVRVNEALARIDTEDFGLCVECGDAIAPKRLAIDPAATLCIGCASGS